MAIRASVIVQYNGGFLPDIILLARAPIFVWFDGTNIIIVYSNRPIQYTVYIITIIPF